MVLYICTTYYHVYITLLKQLNNPVLADMVICDDIPEGNDLTEKIASTSLFEHVWFVKEGKLPEIRGRNVLDWILFQHRRRYQTIRPLLPFHEENYTDIYIYHDGTPLGMYLNDAKTAYHLIEDSYNFYQRIRETPQAKLLKPHNWKFWIRKMLNAGYFPLGESKYVIDIEVNQNKDLQMCGKPIVEAPRKRMESCLTKTDHRIISEIFGHNTIPKITEHSALLLTEPLFADGVCTSLEEQVLLYEKICKRLNKEKFDIFIKPHPRDQADYSGLNVLVVDRYFPIEIWNFALVNDFARAVAVSSSAIFNVKSKEKFFWERNSFVRIKQKGDMK